MPDEVTLGELARRLDSFEKRIDSQFGSVHRQIESLQFVPRDTYQIEMAAIREHIGRVEGEAGEWAKDKTWFLRGIVASILWPVVVALILAFVMTQ